MSWRKRLGQLVAEFGEDVVQKASLALARDASEAEARKMFERVMRTVPEGVDFAAARPAARLAARPAATKTPAPSLRVRKPRQIPVYHGTRGDFQTIDPTRSRAGLGAYVTPNRAFAETFARDDGRVLEGVLSPQNVLDLRKYGAFPSPRAATGIARKIGADPAALQAAYRDLARQQGDVHMFSLLENSGLELPEKTAWRFMDWGEGSPEEAYVFADPSLFERRKARGGLAVKRKKGKR